MSVDAKFIRDIDPYFQYPTDENPTTQQEYQEAVRNWVTTEEAIVDSHLWQPTTNYSEGNQIKTPSLPPQCVLVCTAAGTSGNEEPDYTNVDVGDSVTDGTVTWLVSEAITSAGGTLTGALNTANNTWNNLGDDAAFGDHNVGGKMCVKTQTSTATGIAFFNNSNTNVGQVEVNNAFNFNKAIKQNGIDLTPQTYSIKNTSSDVNVASGSIKNLLSFSITKGTWLVQGVASFPTNSSGYRRLGIATDTSSSYMDRYTVQTTPAVSGVPTQLSFTTCLKTSGTNTYYLNAYQTSGSTLAVTAGVLMFRLSNTAS